ncbi:beta-galactosidase [Flammeovirga agarivorans]|uniref:Glycoside hydrolase family 42 N-terminal domain-containing protein n=1 Tax=Flammeovirga agarivorans TaxID=2726742 RepID=A0A7X8XYC4_9BACT|nr:beta-galactosidase [Flammeovirga agarivorans]NLR94081.1 hypothetical protein [Flammeovirga agarivorans]
MKLFYLLIFLILSNFLQAQVRPTTIGKIGDKPVVLRDGDPILFKGIQYWGLDDWNTGYWEEDIKNIKKLGLNGVRLNIAWDHIEAQEGVFTFDQLDGLLDLLEKNDLTVVLQFNQSAHEWKPSWFEQKYSSKELLVKDVVGKHQYGRLSFSSVPYKKHYYNYVRNTVAHVKNRSSIIAYSVYTEPHFADKEQWLDYNKYNRQGFRTWIKTRYESIDQLNEAWNTTFGSFDKVEPYKKTPESDWTQMPDSERKHFADWNLWNCVAKADFISGLISDCKKIDKNHLFTQNMMWKWSGKYGVNVALDPEINYDYADIIGINVYPYPKNAYKVGASVNFIRSMFQNEKPVWLGEFSIKSGNPTEEDLSDMLSGAFEVGCTGFVYFTYNGQAEKGGEEYGIEHYGVLDRNRKKKDAFYELQNYMKTEVEGNEDEILNAPLPEPMLNVLWPQMNKIYTYLQEDFNLNLYVSAFNYGNIDNDLPVNVITEKQLINGDYDKSLPLLVPPMPMTHKKVGNTLKKHIKNDGLHVFVAGRFNQYTFSNQQEVQNKGVRRLDSNLGLAFQTLVEGTNKHKLTFQKDFYSIRAKSSYTPKNDQISLSPTDDLEVLATWDNGGIAIGIQTLGQGDIFYIGSHYFNLLDVGSNKRAFNASILKSYYEYTKARDQVTSIDKFKKKKKKKRLIRLYDKKYKVEISGKYTYQVMTYEGRMFQAEDVPQQDPIIDLHDLPSGEFIIKIKASSDHQTDIIVIP